MRDLPLNYDNGFEDAWKLLPYLASMKRSAQYLQLRIVAELDAGQSEKALDDLKLLLGGEWFHSRPAVLDFSSGPHRDHGHYPSADL